MNAQLWVTFLMMMFVLAGSLALVGIVSEALGGINESGLLGGP